jgi:hypothetical protein
MIPKLPLGKVLKKILIYLHLKFVFLTKRFLKMNQRYILETFLNAMIKNINTQYFSYILEISKSMEPNKNNYENIYLSVCYDFSKFNGFRKIKL